VWAHVNLGNALWAVHRHDEALVACQRAIELNPTLPAAHNSLGVVLQGTGRADLVIAAYDRALALRADYAEAHNNLGNALLDQGRLDEAIAKYDRAIALWPGFFEAHTNLIVALHVAWWMDLTRLDAALDRLDQPRTLRPESAVPNRLVARILEWEGKTNEARAALDRAFLIEPSDALEVRRALLVPVIYSSLEEVQCARTRIEENLRRLSTGTLAIANPVDDVGANTFYLAYQGKNHRDLLVRLAALHRAATPSLSFQAPHCRDATRRSRARGPIKVGFVSRYFHRHTIGKLNLGLIRNLSREQFSVTVLRFPGPDDAMARAFDGCANEVVNLPLRLEVLQQRIAALELDVLYYCDIGMDAWTYYLAYARLAPVQSP
jgi:tetratricopeptide (TPR) repeat protein